MRAWESEPVDGRRALSRTVCPSGTSFGDFPTVSGSGRDGPSMKIHKIHADSLEYTPQGLRMTEPLPLKVGDHNRVVIVRPKRLDAVHVGLGAFALDSAFPTPGVLMATLRPSFSSLLEKLFGQPDKKSIYQIYGHASASGDDAHNKQLSDRRAKVVAAFFTGDVEMVEAIAKDDQWSVLQWQVVLRVLRCDPGPIDGEVGPLTEAATKLFQQEYREGVFHRHLEAQPRDRELADDGKIGPATEAALIDAYVTACSPHLEQAQMHPTHPVVGCSEFNRVSEEPPELNRRVSVVVHQELPPFHDRAPCTEGDHSVCPLDDRDPLVRCPWYRAHVEDPTPKEVKHLHFDLRWLPLADGRILLSALTSVADGTPVSFQVFRSKPVAHPDEVGAHNLAEPLGEELSATVRAGVAFALWEPPESFDLFDVAGWSVPLDVFDPNEIWAAEPKYQPPVFRVVGGGATAVSPAPGDDFGRIAAPRDSDNEGHVPRTVVAVDAFGRFFHEDVEPGRPGIDRHPLDPDEPRVLLARYLDGVEEDPT